MRSNGSALASASPCVAVGGSDPGQSLETEVQHDEIADVLIVLDDEHATARRRFGAGLLSLAHVHSVAPAALEWQEATDLSHGGRSRAIPDSSTRAEDIMKHKAALIIALAVLTGLTARAFYSRRSGGDPVIVTGAVTRGAIVNNISATGTLEPVTTVEVGTQVSGIVESMNADFNSIVKQGQILARLEPSLFRSAVEQAQANLVRAEADEQRLQVGLADAVVKLERTRQLSERQLVPATDLDAAMVSRQSFEAQVKSAAAAVTQARASLRQAQVNLEKTVVASPIDGIVIARNVDVGQTVAASLQAPTLFLIAADLGEMQVKREHRRIGRRADRVRPGRHLHGRCVSAAALHGDRGAGAAQSNGGVERGHLCGDDQRAEPVARAEARDDGQRDGRGVPQRRRAARPECRAPFPSDRRDRQPARARCRVPGIAGRVRISAASQGLAVATSGSSAAPSESSGASGFSRKDSSVVWVQTDGAIRAVAVRTGVSDGVNTELLDGALPEGASVVTRITLPGATSSALTGTSSPLMPSGPPRR